MNSKLKLIAIVTVAWFLLGWALSFIPLFGFVVDALGWPVCWLFGRLVSSHPDTFGEWLANHGYYNPSGWWDIALEAVNSLLWGVVLGLWIHAITKRDRKQIA